MKAKILSLALLVMVILLIAPLAACRSKTGQASAATQTATVQLGNLSISISAAGNLALSTTQDLTFDLFYTQGTVSSVLVKAGDSITKGEVLASIDQTEWNNQLTALQDKVTGAQTSLQQAQNNLQSSQTALQTTQQNDLTYKLAILNAQINVDQTQNALDTAITDVDYEALKATLDKATTWYNYVVRSLQTAPADRIQDWQLALDKATQQLTLAQANYDNALAGYTDQALVLKERQLEAAKMQLTQAQRQLANLPNAIASATADVALKTVLASTAQTALTEAQNALSQASGNSPQIVAPFSGFVTAVNVKGGDYIYKGTVAIQIADPNKFQSDILVGETNILKISIGQPALITLAALPGVTLSGNVSFISPTAAVQSGVVNYSVTVNVNNTPVQSSAPGANAVSTNSTRRIVSPQTANVQLKDGLNATVSLIILQKSNVLLVPNAAITSQEGQDYVEILLPNGTTEPRAIQVGETDYRNTEVTSGLSAGDKVAIPSLSGTATTSTPSRPAGIGILGRGG